MTNKESELRAQLKKVPVYKVGIYETCSFAGDDVRIGGYVTVLPTHNNKFRDQNVSFRSYTDQHLGIVWGVAQSQDKLGNVLFRRIFVEASRVFDLWNINDIKDYHVLTHHPCMAGANPVLKVQDPEKDAVDVSALMVKRHKVDGLLLQMSDDKVRELVRVVAGINPDRTSMVQCRAKLVEISGRDPDKILSRLEDGDFEYISIMKQLQEAGLINYVGTKGFMYRNGVELGFTESGVVAYLKKDPGFFVTLKRELDNLSKVNNPNRNQRTTEKKLAPPKNPAKGKNDGKKDDEGKGEEEEEGEEAFGAAGGGDSVDHF